MFTFVKLWIEVLTEREKEEIIGRRKRKEKKRRTKGKKLQNKNYLNFKYFC